MDPPSSVEEQLNYFTCTLGEAVPLKSRDPVLFSQVNELIDHLAANNPNEAAVGFCYDMQYAYEPNEWTSVTYSMLLYTANRLYCLS